MMYRSIVLAAALSSIQVATANAQSVYVAPGGVYIGSARVYVAPDSQNGEPHYAAPDYGGPAYAPPAPAYDGPAYRPPGAAYGPPAYRPAGRVVAPAYAHREPVYVGRDYWEETIPRPPAAVPYGRQQRCVVPVGHGRWKFCD